MSELDKLQEYLEQNGYKIKRIDTYPTASMLAMSGMLGFEKGYGEYHQIVVYKEDGDIWWDVICNWGSYGFESGLLEIMGPKGLCNNLDDRVEGWLTAQDIIDRLEAL